MPLLEGGVTEWFRPVGPLRWGGVLLQRARGTDPAVINDPVTWLRRVEKGLGSRYHTDFPHVSLIGVLIQLQVAINTYFAGLYLQRDAYRVTKTYYKGGKESIKVYAGVSTEDELRPTWHQWHIGVINYWAYNSLSVIRLLNPIQNEMGSCFKSLKDQSKAEQQGVHFRNTKQGQKSNLSNGAGLRSTLHSNELFFC